MKTIITWLRDIEHLAGDVYQQAAAHFAGDPLFSAFLKRLAEEEAWHLQVMESAAGYCAANPALQPAISVDTQTSDEITGYFIAMKKGLERGAFSRNELLARIIEAEQSEWNKIFLYVVNHFKEKTGEFKYSAARMQAHITEIECYLKTTEDNKNFLKKINELAPVWVENILVVDDEKMITSLLQALLDGFGRIDVAHDGQQALQLIERNYYKLIITDVDMPVMDGLHLYRAVAERYPESNKRFLFITGDVSPERQAFFAQHRVPYLAKPMQIRAIKEEATRILLTK